MKKLVVASVAVGSVLVLRSVVKRRIVQKMHEHCKQMMDPPAGRPETTGHEATGRKMRQHCEQMAARCTSRRQRRQDVTADRV